MNVAVIIPAAGSASRYQAAGAVRHKLDEDLGGKPVLQRTIETFTKYESDEFSIGPILVAGPHNDEEFSQFKDRHVDRLGLLGARLVRGGRAHRWETVAAALAELPAGDGLVAIHDGARPCLTRDLLDRVLRAARRFGGAVPALPASDTIKRVIEADAEPEQPDRAASILGLAPVSAGPEKFVAGTVPGRGWCWPRPRRCSGTRCSPRHTRMSPARPRTTRRSWRATSGARAAPIGSQSWRAHPGTSRSRSPRT